MRFPSVRQGITLLAYLATVLVNYLSVAIPIGGLTTAQIANRYPIVFLPANVTFGVWGIIYLGLAVYSIDQLRPVHRNDPTQRFVAPLFWLTSVANMGWLILFQYLAFPASTIAMVTLLVALIVIYRRIAASPGVPFWSLRVPFSLYLAWISVATIANFTYVFYNAGWNGWGISAATWTVILLGVAAAIAAAFIVVRRDVAYTAVIVWAFYGIAMKQASITSVADTAIGLSIALVVLLVARLIMGRRVGHSRTTVGMA